MKLWKQKPKRVYLDWAAATPLLPEAKAAMLPFFEQEFGNPSAIHNEGLQAKHAVDGARETVAKVLQVRPEYVTFTSGGTESNNLAIMGAVTNLQQKCFEFSDMEIITTKTEHPSILELMKVLEKRGVAIKYMRVDDSGKIELAHLRELLSEKTILVSCTYVNSEIGVIQPLHSIKKVLVEAERKNGTEILLHVDAAQAPLWLNCQFDSTNADFLTLDAGKFCGPKGTGILIKSKRANLTSILFGGGQEFGVRPGTENVAGVVGASVALKWAQDDWKERAEEVSKIRDEVFSYINETLSGALINGSLSERVANNINFSVPGLDTEFATVVLDKNGFAVSTKSACSGAGGGESKVVKEISDDPARASSTLRFTLGPETKVDEVKTAVNIVKEHKDKMNDL